jgi:hypothetical protein
MSDKLAGATGKKFERVGLVQTRGDAFASLHFLSIIGREIVQSLEQNNNGRGVG